MAKDQISIIHIDTEKSWRGGQQQAAYLHEGLYKRGIKTLMLCPSESVMASYCAAGSIPFNPFHFSHELDYKSGKDAARLALINSASILHLHSGHSVSCGLWAKLFSSKLKLVATRRVDFSIKKNPLSALKYNTGLLDRIVCVSDKIKDVLLADGINEKKLNVIHSGIDIHKFEASLPDTLFRKKWGIPDDAFLVGTIAAFTGHKDYPNLLQAASKLIKLRHDFWFMAVGDGEKLDSMRQFASELGIADRFIFTGFQAEVGIFLKSFDCFVLASKMEGLGTSLLDAMSVGLPIVATDAGGIPEMIQNKENGLLVPKQDPDLLAQAIASLSVNRELRQTLRKNSLESVKLFDIGITIDKYIELYHTLMNE